MDFKYRGRLVRASSKEQAIRKVTAAGRGDSPHKAVIEALKNHGVASPEKFTRGLKKLGFDHEEVIPNGDIYFTYFLKFMYGMERVKLSVRLEGGSDDAVWGILLWWSDIYSSVADDEVRGADQGAVDKVLMKANNAVEAITDAVDACNWLTKCLED